MENCMYRVTGLLGREIDTEDTVLGLPKET